MACAKRGKMCDLHQSREYVWLVPSEGKSVACAKRGKMSNLHLARENV